MEDWQRKKHQRELRMDDREREETRTWLTWTLILVGLLFMVPLMLEVIR